MDKGLIWRALNLLPREFSLCTLLFILEVNMVLKRTTTFLGIAGLFLGIFLIGQGTGIPQTKGKTLKIVPISHSDPSSGKQMFKDYCTTCHGMDGKGDGPAAELLEVRTPDLTTIAKRHHTRSTALFISEFLRNRTCQTNGRINLPVWGRYFREHDPDQIHHTFTSMRIYNLSNYVDFIQQQ
jgi:hypothetical protein